MPQRPTLGFQLFMVLMGAFVGLILIVLHWTWLSLHYSRPNSVWGGFARELVWLDLPFAAMLLGLLSIRSKTVVAPLVGVRLAAERWDLGSGIALVRGDLVDAPPEAVWTAGRDDHEPNALIALMVESTPSEPPPLTSARIGFTTQAASA